MIISGNTEACIDSKKTDSRVNMQMDGGGQINTTCKEINTGKKQNAAKRQRTPSVCRDLLPRSSALDKKSVHTLGI